MGRADRARINLRGTTAMATTTLGKARFWRASGSTAMAAMATLPGKMRAAKRGNAPEKVATLGKRANLNSRGLKETNLNARDLKERDFKARRLNCAAVEDSTPFRANELILKEQNLKGEQKEYLRILFMR